MAQNLKYSPTKVHYSKRTRVSPKRAGDLYGHDPVTKKRRRRTPSNDSLLARLMGGY